MLKLHFASEFDRSLIKKRYRQDTGLLRLNCLSEKS